MNDFRRIRFVATILASLFIIGCSRYVWDNRLYPATEALFSKHSTECESAANQSYPQQLVFVETQPAYKTPPRPAQMHCDGYGNSLSCVTTDPGDHGTQMPARGFSVDANEKKRSAFWEQCMTGKGWFKEKINTEKTTPRSDSAQTERSVSCKESGCTSGLVCINNRCSLPVTKPRKSAPASGACTFDSECNAGQKCVDKMCSADKKE